MASYAERAGAAILGGGPGLNLLGWEVSTRDAFVFVSVLVAVSVAGLMLYLFFRTNLGTAMRATGDNDQMIRALGVNVEHMIVFGLAFSNGLIGLAGALLAQYQAFADVQMGIGMVVLRLASVIIGEALVGSGSARPLDCRRYHGIGALSSAGRHRPEVGSGPQRSQVDHRSVRFSGTGGAQLSQLVR